MVVSVKRPRAIVFDILGTASKSGFLERVLFPYLKSNMDNFISNNWSNKEFLGLYNKIVQQSQEFHRSEPTTPIVLAHDNTEARKSLVNFINFVTDNQVNSPAVTQLRFRIWFDGYQKSKIRTPIYTDVSTMVRRWFAEGIKFYVFSNTWVAAQKALLKNTNHGDLTNLISGHYDNEFGSLLEADSWRRLCNEIKEEPAEVLFLTKSPVEAHAASDAGLNVVLVLTHRHNVKAVSNEDRQRFPYVRTLNDLQWLEGNMMPEAQNPSSVATQRTQSGFSKPAASRASTREHSGSRSRATSTAPTSSAQSGTTGTTPSSSRAASASTPTSANASSSATPSSSRATTSGAPPGASTSGFPASGSASKQTTDQG